MGELGEGSDGLFGRAVDLGILREFVDECAVTSAALALSGEAGTGKTALLDAVAEYARVRGARVLRAAGVEFEENLPFAGLHQLVGPLLTKVAPASTGTLGVALGMTDGPPPSRPEVADAVRGLLTGLAAEGPVLMVIDDLQWFDRPSTMVLEAVLPHLGRHRVGLLVAVRGDGIGHFEGVTAHTVAPLTDDAATAMLRARFPAMAAGVRKRLVDEAKGNPLALLELPVALSPGQRTGNDSLPETLPLSERLREVFASRVRTLPEATRRLLLLAVLEGSGSLAVLAPDHADPKHADSNHADSDSANPDGARANPEVPDLGPAERVGLLTVDHTHGRLVFRHPLTRSAIVELSTSEERRQAHAVLAERLTDHPDRHAWHRAHAVVEPDEGIAALLEQAAVRTRNRGDVAGAVAALLRAAELSPSGVDRRRRLVEAAYVGAVAGGQLRSVPRLLDDALRCDPDTAATPPLGIAVAAAHHLLLSGEGDADTAHRLLVAALDMRPLPLDATDVTVVEAVNTLSWTAYFGGRTELWDAFHRIVARLVPGTPGPLALMNSTLADPARATPLALEELDAAIADLDEQTALIDVVRTSLAGIFVDRLPACREPLRQLRRRHGVEEAGTVLLHILSLSGLERFMAGAWDEAAELADEQVRLAERSGYGLLRCMGLYLQAMLAAGRGDDKAVTELTDRMVGWASPRGFVLVSRLAAQARTLAALGRGDYESAYRHASGISPPGVLASHVPHALWLVTDLTEAAMRTGRRAEAEAHVAAAHAAGLGAFSPRYALLMDAADAMIAPDEQAPARFAAALARPGVEQWPFEHARALLVHGERLRRARMNREARIQLERARQIFERLGAEVWCRRAEREAQPTGSVQGPASLTAQQLTIVELAAAGLSNKQIAERLFLSSRTVGTHLYQAFPKLGVTSRAGLRDALRHLSDTERQE
ncbi:MAG TPA: AAA family ATPase [Pseudonocardiaceae bacterium]|nr:AAA family ATPase [Pseudonocardiaceae bacterium]